MYENIKAEVVMMTPEWSKKLLLKNKHNRPLKTHLIRLYAAQMRLGVWALNGEPIIISDTDQVHNGQHRLTGCVDSNTEFPTLLVTGVRDDTFSTVDTGAMRNAADVLSISGMDATIAKICGSAASIGIPLELSGTPQIAGHLSHKITPQEKASWVLDNPTLIEIAGKVKSYGRKNKHISAAQTTVLWYFMSRIVDDLTEEFFDGFLSGVNLEEHDARLVARDRLDANTRSIHKLNSYQKMGVVIRAWSRFIKGKKIPYPKNVFKDLAGSFHLILPPKMAEKVKKKRQAKTHPNKLFTFGKST